IPNAPVRARRRLTGRGGALFYARSLGLTDQESKMVANQSVTPSIRRQVMATATKGKPALKLQPLEDRVGIQPSDEAESMGGGLYIPDTAKEKPTQGEVIAVGPGRFEKGARVAMDLKVGDKVIYGKYSGTPFTLDGDEVIIIKASHELATMS